MSQVDSRIDPDSVLLEEARQRCDREDALNNTYQRKVGFFLALAGFFGALVGNTLTRIVDRGYWRGELLEWVGLVVNGCCFIAVFFAIWTLIEASLNPRYQTIATPDKWRKYLSDLRNWHRDSGTNLEGVGEGELLNQKLLDAWIEAASASRQSNSEKARKLAQAHRLLKAVLILGAVGLALSVIESVSRTARPEEHVTGYNWRDGNMVSVRRNTPFSRPLEQPKIAAGGIRDGESEAQGRWSV